MKLLWRKWRGKESSQYNIEENSSAFPVRVKCLCPNCNKGIELLIVGVALLPSGSKVFDFNLTWVEGKKQKLEEE